MIKIFGYFLVVRTFEKGKLEVKQATDVCDLKPIT